MQPAELAAELQVIAIESRFESDIVSLACDDGWQAEVHAFESEAILGVAANHVR